MSSSQEPLFYRLRRLRFALGRNPNKHDVAAVLISACIEDGIDTRGGIIDALKLHGLKPSHVAILLKLDTGDEPQRNWWRRDEDGRYTLHDQQP